MEICLLPKSRIQRTNLLFYQSPKHFRLNGAVGQQIPSFMDSGLESVLIETNLLLF